MKESESEGCPAPKLSKKDMYYDHHYYENTWFCKKTFKKVCMFKRLDLVTFVGNFLQIYIFVFLTVKNT